MKKHVELCRHGLSCKRGEREKNEWLESIVEGDVFPIYLTTNLKNSPNGCVDNTREKHEKIKESELVQYCIELHDHISGLIRT